MIQPADTSTTYRNFRFSVALFRGSFGLLNGMYLFLFGPVVNAILDKSLKGQEHVPWFGNDSLKWTAALYLLGVILDFALQFPTGKLADIMGRKAALVLSLVSRFVNLSLMFFLIVLSEKTSMPWYTIILLTGLYWVFFSIFSSLQDGAYEAWIKSFLHENDKMHLQSQIFAFGENWTNALFLVGAALGVSLWASKVPGSTFGHADLAYLIGMGISILCAGVCGLTMPENRRADFRAVDKTRRGWGEFPSWYSVLRLLDSDLIVVFLVNAAITALVRVINLTLFIFIAAYFFVGPMGFWPAVWITLCLGGARLIGNYIFSHYLRRHLESSKDDLSIRPLVLWNVAFNAILVVPIIAASISFWIPLPEKQVAPAGGLIVLIVLVSIHMLGASAYRVVLLTLQNRLVSDHRETASILSLGAMIRNLVIIILIITGVGQHNGQDGSTMSLNIWMLPAAAVIVMTCIMLLKVKEKPEAPKPPTRS